MGFMTAVADFLFERSENAEPQPMVGFPTGGYSGVLPYALSATTVQGLNALARCLDIIGSISTLPWREHRGTLDLPLSRLTRRPVSFYTRREWVQLVSRSMALFDVAYLLKLGPYDTEGVPSGLWPVPPTIIVPRTTDTYSMVPPNEYMVGNTTISADNLVIIRRAPSPGVPDYLTGLMNLARAELASNMAATNFASRYWQGGGSPNTYLTTDANLSDTQATGLGNRWTQRRAQGPDHPVVLSNGLKAAPWGADPLTESAVEARRDMVADIARRMGIPARLANAPSLNTETYQNSQEENLDLLKYTLGNYIGGIEDAITDQLPGGRSMTMETSQFTTGTQFERFQAYNLATGGIPWMTPAEVREDEKMPPTEVLTMVDESQRPLLPLNTSPVSPL